MSVVAVASVGSAVVGGIVANNASKRATEAAQKSEDAALAFERERYDDFQATYGVIEDNLSDYYGGLTTEYYEALGLENFQIEHEANLTQLNENLAQRGITDSAVGASLEFQSEIGAAETRATIRRDAERQVNADKTNFLQIGLGQNPANSVSNVLAQQSAGARDRANVAEQAAGQAIGGAIQAVGTGITNYVRG